METISPANAARLFEQLGSSRAVAKALNITRPRATRLLQIAGADQTPKTFEQLHPRPENAQEMFDECGSSRAFGARYGVAQRTATRILKHWGIKVASSGREDGGKINVTRIWCADLKKPCTLFGSGECRNCKEIYYAYKR